MNNHIISGGISGAITDPYSDEAEAHAIKQYGAIRKSTTDIKKIAKNTGYSESQILLIKNYLFLDMHELDNGYQRFEPDFYIAQSWHRLAFEPDNIKEHDLMLLKHELSELELVIQGYSQSKAHDITNIDRNLNYQKLADEYYENLDLTQKSKKETNNKNRNSGAIIYSTINQKSDIDFEI